MACPEPQPTANRRRSMTIRRRLTFSFVIILTLFALNLVIYFWGNQRRQATVEDLRRAVRRQLLISSIHENLSRIQKQVTLLGQVVAAPGGSATPPEELAQFRGQVGIVTDQTAELRELSGGPERAAVDRLAKSYAALGASWTSAFANLGANYTQAVAELAIHAEPL